MRIATAGMCSNASGMESSSTFMALYLEVSRSSCDYKLARHPVSGPVMILRDGLEVLRVGFVPGPRVEARIGERDRAAVERRAARLLRRCVNERRVDSLDAHVRQAGGRHGMPQ